MLDEVRDCLEAARGTWPQIAQETGLNYEWLVTVAQGGIRDPGVQKIQRLWNYFRARREAPAG